MFIYVNDFFCLLLGPRFDLVKGGSTEGSFQVFKFTTVGMNYKDFSSSVACRMAMVPGSFLSQSSILHATLH